MVALTDIRDAMNPQSRDMELARKLAAEYVTDNPDEFAKMARCFIGADGRTQTTPLVGSSREDLVQAVSGFRAAGALDDMWRVEILLLVLFPDRQKISGHLNQKLNPESLKGLING